MALEDETPESLYDQPYSIVSAQVDAMNARADAALEQARLVIDELKNTELTGIPEQPEYSDENIEPPSIEAFSGSAPDPNLFGGIDTPEMPEDPGDGSDLIGDIDFSDIEVPEFTSSVGEITIPAPPTPASPPTPPTAPTLGAIALPEAPEIEIPELDSLEDITLPAFEFPELPTFDGQAPTFDGQAPDTALDYTEPEYQSENLNAVQAQVATMMEGGTGIPKAVEDAIFARAVERADAQGGAAVEQAFDDFAGRGFDMPPGMLNAQVNAAREQQAERVAEARRDVFVQASQWEIENLRFAVQQGMALEQVLVNIFDNAANRALRMAELRQQGDLALYDAQVSLFNARQQAYQVQAQVFEKRLNAALSKLEVYRTQIEGEKAKSEVNQQKVAAYQAQVGAVREKVNIYTARMQAVESQTRAQSNEIDRFRAEVEAYGRQIDADKIRYDAYESQVRAEASKADIVNAESRAFASTVDAQRSRSNLRVEQIRAKLSAVDTSTQRFASKVQAERDFVAAQASVMQSRSQAYQADVGRYSAEVDADRSRHELQQRVVQDKLRNSLAYYETQVRQYDAALSRLIQEAQVKSDSVSAAGQMASQLAAGAMSAMNVSASLSGSAAASNSFSKTYYYDRTENVT